MEWTKGSAHRKLADKESLRSLGEAKAQIAKDVQQYHEVQLQKRKTEDFRQKMHTRQRDWRDSFYLDQS